MHCNLDALVEYVHDLIEFLSEKLPNYMHSFSVLSFAIYIIKHNMKVKAFFLLFSTILMYLVYSYLVMLRSAEGFIFQCYFQFRRKTVWKHLNIFCGMRNCFNYQLIIFFLMKLLYYRKLKMSRKVHVFIADESS